MSCRSPLIFANWKPRRSPEFSSGPRIFRARERYTEQFTCDKVRSGSRRSTVADSSSELAEPRGIPRGMRRDFGSNRGEFHALDRPRLFSPDVINYFLRAVRTFDEFHTKIQAMWDGGARLNCCLMIVIVRHHVGIKFSTHIQPAIYCISATACIYGLIKTKETSRRSWGNFHNVVECLLLLV